MPPVIYDFDVVRSTMCTIPSLAPAEFEVMHCLFTLYCLPHCLFLYLEIHDSNVSLYSKLVSPSHFTKWQYLYCCRTGIFSEVCHAFLYMCAGVSGWFQFFIFPVRVTQDIHRHNKEKLVCYVSECFFCGLCRLHMLSLGKTQVNIRSTHWNLSISAGTWLSMILGWDSPIIFLCLNMFKLMHSWTLVSGWCCAAEGVSTSEWSIAKTCHWMCFKLQAVIL